MFVKMKLSLGQCFVSTYFMHTALAFEPSFPEYGVQKPVGGSSIQKDSFIDNLVASMTIPELGEKSLVLCDIFKMNLNS